MRLHIERLNDALEGNLRSALHARIGGANRGVEAIDGSVKGTLGLLCLLGRGRRRKQLVLALRMLCAHTRGVFRPGRRNCLRSLMLYQSRGIAVFRTLQRLRPGRLRLRRWRIGANIALRGELATIVDDELFDICHGLPSSLLSRSSLF